MGNGNPDTTHLAMRNIYHRQYLLLLGHNLMTWTGLRLRAVVVTQTVARF